MEVTVGINQVSSEWKDRVMQQSALSRFAQGRVLPERGRWGGEEEDRSNKPLNRLLQREYKSLVHLPQVAMPLYCLLLGYFSIERNSIDLKRRRVVWGAVCASLWSEDIFRVSTSTSSPRAEMGWEFHQWFPFLPLCLRWFTWHWFPFSLPLSGPSQ